MVKVRVEIKRLHQAQARLAGATAKALNRTAISVRAAGSRAISNDMGLRVGDVREQIVIKRATVSTPSATLTVRSRRIPLIKFGARGPEPSKGRGAGVTYRIGARGRQRRPHAFIATMKSGHRGVFQRQRAQRLPIVELFGPSLTRVFTRRTTQQAMRDRYAEVMPKELQREIAFVLKRL